MEFKKLITILSLTVIVLVVCVLGGSLAWYALANAGTTFNTTTANPSLNIVYAQSEYVNTTTGVPIAAADVNAKASKSQFSALAGTNLTGYKVSIEIALTDITIAPELKVADFKYELLENGASIATGTGATIGNNTKVVLKNLGSITVGSTYNYELRIWLQDSGVSQNSLMGKAFNAKIQISSAIKK